MRVYVCMYVCMCERCTQSVRNAKSVRGIMHALLCLVYISDACIFGIRPFLIRSLLAFATW